MTTEEVPTEPKNPSTRTDSRHWIWQALITGAALTAAANYLIYSRGPGAGWATFFLLLAAAIFVNRRSSGLVRSLELALGVILAASAVQMVVRPSFSNAVVIFALTLIASTHFLQDTSRDIPAARKLAEALRNLLLSPLRWMQASGLVARDGIARAPHIAGQMPSPRAISRGLQIIVPAAIIILPFAVLLGKGNSILGQVISNTLTDFLNSLAEVSPPSPGRLFFIASIASIILGLLWRTNPSKVLDRIFAKLGRTIPAPGDHFVARWRTILVLAGVNILFFAANSIDLTYLGASDVQLPRHLTYSEFVHQGTNTLIASAIIAAIVLSLLFQQHESVTAARSIRGLAILWIAQNVLLIANVARRVGIYIGDYHLTALRLHLILFLALVCVGFTLLAVRILRHKSFGWLVSTNLAAVFVLFASVQFWDTRASVAKYNLARALEDDKKTLDVYYLSELGPSAWPTLEAASRADLSKKEKSEAADALASIASLEHMSAELEDWRDFRWQRNHLRRTLLAVKH